MAGLHCCSADSVELDPATVLLYWGSSQRKHSLLSGTKQWFRSELVKYCANTHSYALFYLSDDFFSLQFFTDVKEAQDKIKKMQEGIKKKYSCDRTTTTTRLEDLLQDAAVSTNYLLSRSVHVFYENIKVIIRTVYSTSGGKRAAKWIQDPCEQPEQESKVGHSAETTQPHHCY